MKKKESFATSDDDEVESESDVSEDESEIEEDTNEEDDASSDADSEIEDDISEKSDSENVTTMLYSKGILNEDSEIEKGKAVRNQLGTSKSWFDIPTLIQLFICDFS